jgi:3-oxoacyl-[acyl-carrier-protein] synthase II
MRHALEHAQLSPDQIEHVNLHGTGTATNDASESQAMHRVFGERAATIPVNSLKPMFGHTLGAAGVLELAGTILGMQGGFVAPTLNTEELDPACNLNVVRGYSLKLDFDKLLSTKSAFGGANVAIAAHRYVDPDAAVSLIQRSC